MSAGRRERPRVLVLVGPTGSGKSACALALARELDGEIVSCDALQVYRGFDVGTAKPDPRERAAVPHHLIDHVDPRRDYSLADWVRDAEAAITAIAARGCVPLVVGGTGLYLRGLLRGVVQAPPRNENLRARLRRVADRRGDAALHRWLAGRDPASARRIAPTDRQRVVRALELALGGDATWSERLEQQGHWEARGERYPNLKFGLDVPREDLVGTLDGRVELFFRRGWVQEVRHLLENVPTTANAFKAIGYREILAALRDGKEPGAPEEAEIKRSTRRYAKRQRTWFRRERDVVWLDGRWPEDRLVRRMVTSWREG